MNKQDYITTAILGCAPILIVIVLFTLFSTKEYPAKLVNKSWEYSLSTEKYDWVHEEEKSGYCCPSAPDGAKNIRNYKRSSMEYNSFSECWESDTDYYVEYDIQEWVFDKTLLTIGNEDEDPSYPYFVPDNTHRERDRSEKYIYNLIVYKGEKELSKQFSNSDFSFYNRIDRKSDCKVELNKFGSARSLIINEN